MVIFLEQIHPVYSVTPLTDGVLEKLLSLSDEYQVDHIRQKCLQYIGSQINSRGWLPTEQVLLYLFVCERHQLIQHREILLNMAADQELLELERCDRFQCLEESTRAELIKTRCSQLEEKDRDSKYTEKLQIQREVMKTKAQMFDLPVCCFPLLPEKCVPCCYPCPHGLFPKRPSRYSSSFSSNPANCTNDSCVRSYMIRSYCKCCMTEKLKM